jgi:hypothetical protein
LPGTVTITKPAGASTISADLFSDRRGLWGWLSNFWFVLWARFLCRACPYRSALSTCTVELAKAVVDVQKGIEPARCDNCDK